MRGENLAACFVYTPAWSIPDVIAAADEALSAGLDACALTPGDQAATGELVVLLRAINQGEVTYAPPDPVALAAGRVPHPPPPPGMGDHKGM